MATAALHQRTVKPGWLGLSSPWADPLSWSHFRNNPVCLQQHRHSGMPPRSPRRLASTGFFHRCAHAASSCVHTSAPYVVFQILRFPFSPPVSSTAWSGGRVVRSVLLEKWCFFGDVAAPNIAPMLRRQQFSPTIGKNTEIVILHRQHRTGLVSFYPAAPLFSESWALLPESHVAVVAAAVLIFATFFCCF